MHPWREEFACALIYAEELTKFEFSPHHPFKPVRAKIMMDLCRRYGLLEKPGISVIKPKPLTLAEMAKFHAPNYLEFLQIANSLNGSIFGEGLEEWATKLLEYGLGTEDNPIFPGVYDFAALCAGATQLGAELVAADEVNVAFNPLGGFHHARRNRAEGFCYINDIAITITNLIHEGCRVAFVDIDAHHGNGVQEAFYYENRVLKISFHESGLYLYPGTGFVEEIGAGVGRGYNINVPLPKGSDDGVFLKAFKELVPPLIESFRPDVLIAQIGADMHVADPLTHLKITNFGYGEAVRIIAASSPAILALGGGGYDIYKTARNWTLAWSILSRQEARDEYAGLIGGMMYGPEVEAGELHDLPIYAQGKEKERLDKEVDKILAYIKKVIFPIHKI